MIRLAFRGLQHHGRTTLPWVAGAALTTALLVGSWVVGDCLRASLEAQALSRVGHTTLMMDVGARPVRESLETILSEALQTPVVGALAVDAVASRTDGTRRRNDVKLWGISPEFSEVGASPGVPGAQEVYLSAELAEALALEKGQEVVLRTARASALPGDVSLTRADDSIVALRVTIGAIITAPEHTRYAPGGGTSPLNAWINREWLQERMQLRGRVNVLAISSSEIDADQAHAALASHWRLDDIQSGITCAPQGLRLTSSRVLLDPPLREAATQLAPGAVGVLSWLANALEAGERSSPYGIVTALGALEARGDTALPDWIPKLAEDAIALNAWTAEDLDVTPGATATLRYSTLGQSRQVAEETRDLRITQITPMKGLLADPGFLPPIPGITDADSCKDWAPGLPVDLEKMRPADEAYWETYRGTPRAFLALGTGQELWGSPHGNLTAVIFDRPCPEARTLEDELLRNTTPASLGMTFEPVREAALLRAEPASDFGGLFLGFNLFLVLAALLLTTLLTTLAMEGRSTEIGALLAMGWSPGRVRRLFTLEAGMASLAGVLLGIPLARGVTEAVLHGLSGAWSGASPGAEIVYAVEPGTLGMGAGITAALMSGTAHLCLGPLLRRTPPALLQRRADAEAAGEARSNRPAVIAFLCGSGALLLTLALPAHAETAPAFFGAGALALISALAAMRMLLQREPRTRRPTLTALAMNATRRRPRRSMTVMTLLAAGSFLVIGVGAGHVDPLDDTGNRSSGTGGFAWVGETTIPIAHDLETPQGRDHFHLPENAFKAGSFLPLHVWNGDDASCLSLGQARTPTLLGLDPEELARREAFTFHDSESSAEGWRRLGNWSPGDPIPAVGDEATIRWQLHRGVGDSLRYVSANGTEFEVILVGMVRNAMFQGALVVPEEALVAMHPDLGGVQQFWFDGPSTAHDEAPGIWMDRMTDSGLALTPASERFARFVEVERTYLGIFEVLGALGLLLGVLGLGLVLARNVGERRQELAALMALGFSPARIRWLLFAEHGALALAGMFAGSLAAALAIAPALRSNGYADALETTGFLVFSLILAGGLAMAAAVRMVIHPRLTETLRGDGGGPS